MRIFISYSRRDSESADQFVAALEERGHEVTIDRRDLPYGEQWQIELARMIREAETILWLVSRESIASSWCLWELGETQRMSKRLIPIRIAVVSSRDLPETLGKLHCLPATEVFDPQAHLEELFTALDTDQTWVREHATLFNLATTWSEAGKSTDRLLRGGALVRAERWIDEAPSSAPSPAAEVIDYVLASRRAASARSRRQRILTLGIAAGAVALSIVALTQKKNAVLQQQVAEANEILANRSEAKANEEAAKSDRLRRSAQLTAIRTAEDRSNLLIGIADKNENPLMASLVALESWSGAGGEFPGFDQLDEFIDAGGSEDPSIPVPTLESLQALPDYSLAAGRLITNIPRIREELCLGDWEQGKFWAIAPEQGRVACLQDSGSGNIWTTQDNRPPVQFHGNDGALLNLAFSPDGQFLAAGSENGGLHIWDAASGALLQRFSVGDKPLNPMVFSPITNHLAFGIPNGKIVVFEVERDPSDPSKINEAVNSLVFEGHHKKVHTIKWASTGRLMASSAFDNQLIVWDPFRGVVARAFETPQSVFRLDSTPDGRRIAGVMGGISIAVWDVDQEAPVFSLRWEKRQSAPALLSDDGKTLYFSKEPGEICSQALETGKEPFRFRCDPAPIHDLILVPGEELLVASHDNGTIQGWKAADPDPVLTLHVDEKGAMDKLYWNPHSKRLVGSSFWGTARSWTLESLQPPPQQLQTPENSPEALQFSFTGDYLLGTSEATGSVVVWTVDTGHIAFESSDHNVEGPRKFALDDRILTTHGGKALFLNPADGSLEELLAFDGLRIRQAMLSFQGRHIVAIDHLGRLAFLPLAEGGEHSLLEKQPESRLAYAWASDPQSLLLTVDAKRVLGVWDTGDGTQLRTVPLGGGDAVPMAAEKDESGTILRIAFSDGSERNILIAGPESSTAPDASLPLRSESIARKERGWGMTSIRIGREIAVIDAALAQVVYRIPSEGIPLDPTATSFHKGLVAESIYHRDGARVLMHKLPALTSRVAAPRALKLMRKAQLEGRTISDEESEFWSLEQQRYVFRKAMEMLPRPLDDRERKKLGLGNFNSGAAK